MKHRKTLLTGIFLAGMTGITLVFGEGVPALGNMGAPIIASAAEDGSEGTDAADNFSEAAALKETAGTALTELGLEDGVYLVDVTLSGGSGRASVESPATVTIEDGKATATITFSSPYYDYMLLDGERYEPVNTEGNSTFEIPVSAFDCEIAVTADTTAMSTPHEIDYTLCFDSASIRTADEDAEKSTEDDTETADAEGDTVSVAENEPGATEDTGAAEDTEAAEDTGAADLADDTDSVRSYSSGEDWCGLTWESSLELLYAEQFTVDYYEGGYTRIVIADEDVYLLVPETADTSDDGASAEAESETDIAAAAGMDTETVLESLPNDVVVLQQPIENIYLVATSAMDFFVSLDALDSIRLSGTNADGWYIEEAQEAMEAGDILYAGKYSAPDYELILSENCGLAIESTMIYHNPEVREKLETFGIPVLVERSSYESHPMGRTEWIKLYAVLLGLEDEAEEIFSEQVANVQAIESEESLEKTVAFFYITSAGAANVRKSNDYVAKMIELAGGTYVFEDLGEDDSATSTINMTMEEFYAGACDADYIIYNSTIDGELYTMDELLGKSALLADFTAVQNGNVWCTGKNLFQETTSLGDLIVEIHTILSDEDVDDGELEYLHRIEE